MAISSAAASTERKPRLRAITGGKAKAPKPSVSSALRTLEIESEGLRALTKAIAGNLAEPFANAVETLRNARGRVIVTGIGKSGHVGQKLAATLASTGTPAFFVHPSEASHGDLGMITSDDVILALSWSGETVELKGILTFSRRFEVSLIAITSKRESALGRTADIVLELPRVKEACPHGLAPTTSTTIQLALGDALAVALLEAKGFTAERFKDFHPGGSLDAQLKFVSDVMHKADQLPLARETTAMSDAILIMTQRSFGCLGVVDDKGNLVGVVTDGDLRRKMSDSLLAKSVSEVMNTDPKTIKPGALASSALKKLNARRITALFVVERKKPVGIVHVHDLLRMGVV